MAKLIVMTPNGEQSEHALRAINTLGRHPDQTVQILDRVVSKEHALVTFADEGYWLQDMGSRNGTFVNGVQIRGRTRLRDGDTITLGSTRVMFVADQSGGANRSRDVGNVTIQQAGVTDTAIRSRVQADETRSHEFLPELQITDDAHLRADYEKLRIAFELNQAIGTELDIDLLLDRILEKAFEFTNADRGVILLMNRTGEPEPRALKNRRGKEEKVELSQTILNEVIEHHNAVLSSDATMDSRFGGSHSIIMQGIRSTMCVPLMTGDELLGMIHLDTRIATGVFTEKDLRVLTVFANQAALKIANARLAKQAEDEAIARHNLSRLLSPNLVEQVVKGSIAMEKGGELREATVLFSDIRGFTAMSGRLDPHSIVSMLNEYFEIMVDIVFRYDGTLDKFVGDELMAVWGAPLGQVDHTERALRAALDMMKALEDFNRFRVANGEDAIKVGCGINSGRLVAGYMGSTRTMSYTVIGDTVNTASRLCSHAGPGEVLITDPIRNALGPRLTLETRPMAELKGIAQPLPIYRVLALK
ncbi:MAG: FHA domain-containing protein [Myxococcales bacterium]|nr:FHA domain-containing protein [Myxococcales bacterium]